MNDQEVESEMLETSEMCFKWEVVARSSQSRSGIVEESEEKSEFVV